MQRLLRNNLGFLTLVVLVTGAIFGAGCWFYIQQEIQQRDDLVAASARQTLANIEPIVGYLLDYYEFDLLRHLEHSHEQDAYTNYLVVLDDDGAPVLDHRPAQEVADLMQRRHNREFRREAISDGGREFTLVVGLDPRGHMAGLPLIRTSVWSIGLLCTVLISSLAVSIMRTRTAAAVHGIEIMRAHEAKELAESVGRARSEFLANMSHEIRTPLNGVVGIIELLGSTPLAPDQEDLLGDLQTSSSTLMDLLDQVLDAARIDAGQFHLEEAETDPVDLIRNVEAVFRGKATQKGVTLTTAIGRDMPALVRCDPTRLQQVLNNLVGNALKFTAKGGITLGLSCLPCGRARTELHFCVADTGVGIPEESFETIFEPFTQAEGHSARKYGGTGLGLTICRQIVELMDGTISCRNRPEGGAEFRFAVVVDMVADQAPIVARVPLPVAGPGVGRLPARILVVEDNPLNQKVVSMQLANLGFVPVLAADGIEAISITTGEAFDLILMDCQMPQVDGYEATREIRRREGQQAHVPIVATTANALPGDLEKCLDAGMDGFLAKPISQEELARTLEQWLPAPEPVA